MGYDSIKGILSESCRYCRQILDRIVNKFNIKSVKSHSTLSNVWSKILFSLLFYDAICVCALVCDHLPSNAGCWWWWCLGMSREGAFSSPELVFRSADE